MAILIDGYNLIHAAGIVARRPGPGGLERARQALLDFLAVSLSDEDCRRTSIVFDAQAAPPGLAREMDYHGLTVRFAVGYADADELIEQLIKKDSAPRQLVVVSSDHRLHRAARRRRAKAIDSDVWYAEIVRQRMARQRAQAPHLPPQAAISKEEIDAWARDIGQGEVEPVFPKEYLERIAEEADENADRS